MNLNIPSFESVRFCLKKWNASAITQKNEKEISKLFINTSPKNIESADVINKIEVLNDKLEYGFSADILNLLAKKVLELSDMDAKLSSRDITLVSELNKVEVAEDKQQGVYSLITKYCGYHVKSLKTGEEGYDSEKEFPAFDRFSAMMLQHYNSQDSFTGDFEIKELEDYGKYVEVINDLRKHYKLEDYSLKEICIFLSISGKKEQKLRKNTGKKSGKKQRGKSSGGRPFTGKGVYNPLTGKPFGGRASAVGGPRIRKQASK